MTVVGTVTAAVLAGVAVPGALGIGRGPRVVAAGTAAFTSAPATPATVLRPPVVATAVPTPPSPPAHDRLAPAPPREFTVSGPAFSVRARVCSMDATLPLDPPGEQHHTVCWVNQRFGVAPGSDTGTTFILGHSWARDRHEVLNPLSSRATAQLLTSRPRLVDGVRIDPITVLNGYLVTLRTSRGILRYRVRDAYGVNKYAAHAVRAMWSSTIAHRLVIITCAERDGRDYDDNIVVDAYLVSSQRMGAAGG